MIGYVTLGATDFGASLTFYDAVLAVLGHERSFADEGSGWAAWGAATGARLFICKPFDGNPPTVGNGSMVALLCADDDMVRRAHAAALATGGRDEGAPGTREAYGPDFFVAYVRDPFGNKLSFFHDRSAG